MWLNPACSETEFPHQLSQPTVPLTHAPTLSTTLSSAFDKHCTEPGQCAGKTTAFFHINFLLDFPAEMTQLEMPKQTEGRGHNSGIQHLNQVMLAQQPSEPANETGRDYLGFVVSVRCLATNQV